MANALATQLLLIRHAEKPDAGHGGVSESGASDDRDLTVRGWQRAGALALFFGTTLARPQFLFASHTSSARPRSTLVPLSAKLGVPVNLDFGKGDEAALAEAAKACEGVVLIAWQHEEVVNLANAILGAEIVEQQRWPKERFDMVWVFDLEPGGAYRWSQVPQMILAADSDQPM